MASTRLALAAVVVLAVVALAGCTTTLSNDSSPDADALVADAMEGDDAEAVVGERTVEYADGNGNETTTERVWETGDRYRLETVSSPEGEYDGDVVVDNGTSILSYDADTDEAIVRDPSTTANVTEGLESTYVGTDTVAGRDVHVVDVDVRNESVKRAIDVVVGDTRFVYPVAIEERDIALQHQRLWIDEEYGYVLKQREIYEDPDGTELEVTSTFEEVSFGERIDDDRFELPDDADVVDPDPQQWEFADRAEADDHVAFDLPDAEFPDDYELRAVRADEYEGRITVHEEYAVGSDLLWYSVAEEGLMPAEPDRENVGTVNATVLELDGPTLLTWECGGLQVQLSGPFDVEGLLELAEGVPCE
ncbi:hypothetical protein [Saliphagus sp. LR7]|uniref:LolA family protein n=1 Tax=Saliphagus sp. LR7 TaxID=2282654 RepID=UPI000DF86635|nr:hypothetical protein [Saliphagus sp. LR7]